MTKYNTLKRIESSIKFVISLIPEDERPEGINELLPQPRKIPVEVVSDISLYLVSAQRLIKRKDYETAIAQLYIAIDLIKEWDAKDLKVDLYTTLSNAYRLKTNFQKIIEVTDKALDYVETNEQRIIVCELNADSLTSLNQIDKAFEKITELFKSINFDFNQNSPEIVDLNFIYYLPEASEEWHLALMRLVKSFSELCVFKCPEKIPSVIFAEIELILKYGKSPLTLSACADYALYLFLFLGEFERGYKIAKQAVSIIEYEKDNNLSIAAVLGVFYALFFPWKHPLKKSVSPLEKAFRAGIETGDFMLANAYGLSRIDHLQILGTNLEELKQENLESLCNFKKMNLPYSFDNTNIYLEMIENLKGESEYRTKLRGIYFNESDLLKVQNPIHRYMFYLVKTILFYLFNEPQKAIKSAETAQVYSASMLKYVVIAQLAFYKLLALLACPENKTEEIERGLKQLQEWASRCPDNFGHWHALAQAEWLRIQYQCNEAKEYYARSIDLAKEQERVQDAAIANELAGKFYLQQGQHKIAETHLIAAHAGFLDWGATAVAQRMEREYDCLKDFDLNTDFAQAICNRIETGCSEDVRKILSRFAVLTYNPATQQVELLVKTKVAAAILAPHLESLQRHSLVKIVLKISS